MKDVGPRIAEFSEEEFLVIRVRDLRGVGDQQGLTVGSPSEAVRVGLRVHMGAHDIERPMDRCEIAREFVVRVERETLLMRPFRLQRHMVGPRLRRAVARRNEAPRIETMDEGDHLLRESVEVALGEIADAHAKRRVVLLVQATLVFVQIGVEVEFVAQFIEQDRLARAIARHEIADIAHGEPATCRVRIMDEIGGRFLRQGGELHDVPEQGGNDPQARRVQIVEHPIRPAPVRLRVGLPQAQHVPSGGLWVHAAKSGNADPEEFEARVVGVENGLGAHRVRDMSVAG
jgi:hypothetical protein